MVRGETDLWHLCRFCHRVEEGHRGQHVQGVYVPIREECDRMRGVLLLSQGDPMSSTP